MLALSALVACGPQNTVGPVAGVPFPIASAHLTVDPGTFGADDLVTVTLSSLPASCEAERSFRAASLDAGTPEALAAAWSAAYPDAFFEVDVAARVTGGTWPGRGALWSGLAWDAFPEQNNVVFGVLTEHVAPRDAAYWEGEYDDEDDYEHVFYTDGGLLQWGAAQPGVRLSGRFNTDVVDGDGADAGSTEIRFDATICGL
jgi:hypothetical protein